MSLAELMLILIVTLVVFGPSKLPQLVRQIEKFIGHIAVFRGHLSKFWHAQQQALQLEENQHKAKQADKAYQRDK